MAQLTKEIVEAAIEGLEARRQNIGSQIAQLRAMLTDGNGTRSENVAPAQSERRVGRKRGRISAAGRAAIAEAQRKRWAAKKAGTDTAVKTAPKKTKRRLSAAGRKAISEATKKRWAAKRAAAKNGSKTV